MYDGRLESLRALRGGAVNEKVAYDDRLLS